MTAAGDFSISGFGVIGVSRENQESRGQIARPVF
jgi:hypothetical protein